MQYKNDGQLTKEEILCFIRTQKPYLEKEFGVTKIALFGSYARGEQTATSDIDLLVEMKQHDFDKRFDLQDFLAKKFGKKVDVNYFGSLRKFIMRQVEEDIIYA